MRDAREAPNKKNEEQDPSPCTLSVRAGTLFSTSYGLVLAAVQYWIWFRTLHVRFS